MQDGVAFIESARSKLAALGIIRIEVRDDFDEYVEDLMEILQQVALPAARQGPESNQYKKIGLTKSKRVELDTNRPFKPHIEVVLMVIFEDEDLIFAFSSTFPINRNHPVGIFDDKDVAIFQIFLETIVPL